MLHLASELKADIVSSTPAVRAALWYKDKTRLAPGVWREKGEGKTRCLCSTCPPDRGLQSRGCQGSVLQQDSMHCKTSSSPQT